MYILQGCTCQRPRLNMCNTRERGRDDSNEVTGIERRTANTQMWRPAACVASKGLPLDRPSAAQRQTVVVEILSGFHTNHARPRQPLQQLEDTRTAWKPISAVSSPTFSISLSHPPGTLSRSQSRQQSDQNVSSIHTRKPG